MVEVGLNSDAANSRRILRLWPADLDVVGSFSERLWLGSIIEERLFHLTPLFAVVWTPDVNGSPIDVLIESLTNTKLVERSARQTSIFRNPVVLLVSDQLPKRW